MNPSNQFQRPTSFWAMGILTAALGILPANIFAAEPNDAPAKPGTGQKSFASPEEAIKALQTATQVQDRTALHEIFGPEFDQLLTGDARQDAKNAEKFAAAVAQSCKPVQDTEDKVTLEVGTNQWPMPIPLVKSDGQWHFDTAAGKEEVITRHIGKDELHAIGVCRAFVKAQQEYVNMNSGSGVSYALRFKSTPGKKDGLYWPSAANEPASPFGPVVAEAQDDRSGVMTSKPQPFHGYFFQVLTRQGPAAAGGKKNYLSHGVLSDGFALLAYPEKWDKSGIMTFIVNQDGKVYERNLGEKTSRAAKRMKEYNPDDNWKLVEEDGILSAVSAKITP